MKISTVAAALLVLASMAAVASADDIVAPGAAWQYTFTDPGAGWQTGGGLGSWGIGNAPFGNNIGGGWDPNFDYVTYWPAYSPLWVRQSIDLSAYDLSTVKWFLGADNGYDLWVNGTHLSGDNAEWYTYRWEYSGDFGGLLTSGINWIGLQLEDHGGLTAFDMNITGDLSPVRPVPEPGTLALLGMGVVGLVARARRNRVA